MGKRRKAREIILKALFQMDIGRINLEDALLYAYGRVQDEKIKEYASSVVRGAWDNLADIDRIISEKSKNWKINRIANVDRNILRIAIYEMLYREDIPTSVSINEAVELAKKYGTEESGKFVNGILGTLVKSENV